MPTNSSFSNQGFTLIEVLVSLAILSGSYWIIFSSQQFVSSYSQKLARDFQQLIDEQNQHELEMVILHGGDE
jgi:prepilin-type N-terminal cleavage/methylation domain-containing protein